MLKNVTRNLLDYIDLSIVNLTPFNDTYAIHEGEVFSITFSICNLAEDPEIIFFNPWLKVRSGQDAALINDAPFNTLSFDKGVLEPKDAPATATVLLEAKCHIGIPFFLWSDEFSVTEPIITTRFIADFESDQTIKIISPEQKIIHHFNADE